MPHLYPTLFPRTLRANADRASDIMPLLELTCPTPTPSIRTQFPMHLIYKQFVPNRSGTRRAAIIHLFIHFLQYITLHHSSSSSYSYSRDIDFRIYCPLWASLTYLQLHNFSSDRTSSIDIVWITSFEKIYLFAVKVDYSGDLKYIYGQERIAVRCLLQF